MKSIKTTKNHIPQECLEHALELAGSEQLWFAQYQAQIVRELLLKQGTTPGTILDYGCGDGTMAYLMHQLMPNSQIHGIDSSEELIEIAQGWYGAQSKRLNFDTHIEQSSKHANTYDLIYLANVLHHIPKVERATLFKKLTEQLAPQGILIVLEFNPYNLLQAWRFCRDKEEQGNQMIMPWSLKKFLTGFGKVDVCYYRKIYATVLKKN